ncbi:NapC/NirT family cytochrome c [Neobacillus sp. YX16]|uniref:cytochrome c3 family protein n=1 Tax=Neobacillus sp. YX16 TaxID=3047874 RepID=UPI0024C22526|nr:NapC/NirT family cytochrome c [Neobacillus sp. YX16]WHZ02356.1 NapC/NirT family cytochrome c [Neobacillus sp. YX16]
MEEEQVEQIPPPRKGYKFIKYLTVAVMFIVVFFSLGLIGVETTSSQEFCSSCHEMKPQYYTLKASSHSEVDCVSCHIDPGAENYAKAQVNGVVEFYKKQTDTYLAPIKMPTLIPDEACERCHNMKSRAVTASGDIIIPHDKHKTEGIECVQCHSGTSHGEISDRKMTYKSDYGKWNHKLGASVMSDTKYIRPQMDTCMECHKARKVTIECTACHESTMIPDDHKTEKFKAGDHGKIKPSDLETCEKCHSYMSSVEYDLFKQDPTYKKYLNNEETDSSNVTVNAYVKTNTFCKDCHGERPKSHQITSFMTKHGKLSKDTQKCFICHENRITSDAPVTNVQCATCHPSSHKDTWRKKHPIDIAENQKYDKSCLKCHVEKTCTKCHRTDSDHKAKK